MRNVTKKLLKNKQDIKEIKLDEVEEDMIQNSIEFVIKELNTKYRMMYGSDFIECYIGFKMDWKRNQKMIFIYIMELDKTSDNGVSVVLNKLLDKADKQVKEFELHVILDVMKFNKSGLDYHKPRLKIKRESNKLLFVKFAKNSASMLGYYDIYERAYDSEKQTLLDITGYCKESKDKNKGIKARILNIGCILDDFINVYDNLGNDSIQSGFAEIVNMVGFGHTIDTIIEDMLDIYNNNFEELESMINKKLQEKDRVTRVENLIWKLSDELQEKMDDKSEYKNLRNIVNDYEVTINTINTKVFKLLDMLITIFGYNISWWEKFKQEYYINMTKEFNNFIETNKKSTYKANRVIQETLSINNNEMIGDRLTYSIKGCIESIKMFSQSPDKTGNIKTQYTASLDKKVENMLGQIKEHGYTENKDITEFASECGYFSIRMDISNVAESFKKNKLKNEAKQLYTYVKEIETVELGVEYNLMIQAIKTLNNTFSKNGIARHGE